MTKTIYTQSCPTCEVMRALHGPHMICSPCWIARRDAQAVSKGNPE